MRGRNSRVGRNARLLCRCGQGGRPGSRSGSRRHRGSDPAIDCGGGRRGLAAAAHGPRHHRAQRGQGVWPRGRRAHAGDARDRRRGGPDCRGCSASCRHGRDGRHVVIVRVALALQGPQPAVRRQPESPGRGRPHRVRAGGRAARGARRDGGGARAGHAGPGGEPGEPEPGGRGCCLLRGGAPGQGAQHAQGHEDRREHRREDRAGHAVRGTEAGEARGARG